MIRPGDRAPSFTLPDHHGNPVSFEDFRGRRGGGGILRTTFVIDGDGIVRHGFGKVRAKGHARDVPGVITA